MVSQARVQTMDTEQQPPSASKPLPAEALFSSPLADNLKPALATTLTEARLYPIGETALVLEALQPMLRSQHRFQRNILNLSIALNQLKEKQTIHFSGLSLPKLEHLSLPDHSSLLDIVPGMNNLTLIFNPLISSIDSWQALLTALWEREINKPIDEHSNLSFPHSHAEQLIEFPIIYGGDHGPDLELVAEHCGLSSDDIIAAHSEAEYIVYFIGFQPGFAYLVGLAPQLITPRKGKPRTHIKAGSVGIGGSQTGIYPSDSPGGWQIIGRLSPRYKHKLFDAHRSPPSLLQAGNRVRFIPCND